MTLSHNFGIKDSPLVEARGALNLQGPSFPLAGAAALAVAPEKDLVTVRT